MKPEREPLDETMNILVVDDEPVVCNSCSQLLREEGFEVDTVNRAKVAMQRMKQKDYDIVITDLRMPEISGLEMLEFIKKNFPDTQVIMITGYSTIANAVESIKQGAFDYVPKPFSPDELLTVVRMAVGKRGEALEKIHRIHETERRNGYDNIVGGSEKMLKIYDLIDRVAPTDATVLITGESGTGKELIARAIYNHSARSDKQYIAVDCSTLAESLLESELFGHAKGAFTGALADKRGVFELAHEGTLLLDEVSNIPLEIQKKLLRVLEQREYKAVGAETIKKIDIRLVAATNRDLKLMINKENFREDLFYRLNVFSIEVPPLRERPEDIPLLASHFLKLVCRSLNRNIKGFSKEAMALLIRYQWPGNVRELKNVVERLVLMAENDLLCSEKLTGIIASGAPGESALIPATNEELKAARKEARENAVRNIEKAFLMNALAGNGWNITRAAENTGMIRTNFQALVKKYNIHYKE
jgi:DNA-binding NtrC family response regulator